MMAQLFGHERLVVYQKSMAFVKVQSELLEQTSRRISASDHLARAAESILFNIAHASSSWTPKERLAYLGYANGSALECAACLDIFVAKALLADEIIDPMKASLSEIVSMLIAMRKTAANRICEEASEYRTAKGRRFSHEDLEVYQTALRFTGWVESASKTFSCSEDLLFKLDSSSTTTVLNIAEGNGRFSGADRVKFLAIAYKATVQSASLLDLAVIRSPSKPLVEDARNMLRSTAAMLKSLSAAIKQDSLSPT
ncbi:MAG: four helix bundle protein [Kiritimatiellia bacterium]|jgi:four helix bundle protein